MKKSAITSAIVAVVVLVFVRLFQVNQMPSKGHSVPTSDENQIESFQQTVIWATNQESDDQPKAGSDNRKISGNAPASPPDLGPDAGIGNPAARAALHEVRVPPGWLEQQSDFVRRAVSNKQFVTSKDGVLGVIDASGRFVTWPGAPSNSARF
jgi:hypothetical protein